MILLFIWYPVVPGTQGPVKRLWSKIFCLFFGIKEPIGNESYYIVDTTTLLAMSYASYDASIAFFSIRPLYRAGARL